MTLRRAGITFVIVGLLRFGVTLIDMIGSFDAANDDGAASTLAADIAQSLTPSTVGMPILFAGIVLLIMVWWRDRSKVCRNDWLGE